MAIEQIEDLLKKYDLLLRLHAEEPGRTLLRRDRIREVTAQFPGAMREWEKVPQAELLRRRAHVATLRELASRDEAAAGLAMRQGEPWLRYAWELHACMRALLLLRGLQNAWQKEPAEARLSADELLAAARRCCIEARDEVLAKSLDAQRLQQIFAPPTGGRLTDFAYEEVAARHQVAVIDVKLALFGVA